MRISTILIFGGKLALMRLSEEEDINECCTSIIMNNSGKHLLEIKKTQILNDGTIYTPHSIINKIDIHFRNVPLYKAMKENCDNLGKISSKDFSIVNL